MIVDIPFHYDMPYVPHRGRTVREAIVSDKAPIVVAEATAQEAPLALKVDAGRFSNTWNAGEPRNYRFHAGSFWRPYSVETKSRSGNRERNARYAPMPSAEFIRQAERGESPLSDRVAGWKLNKGVPVDSLMPCRFQASPETLRARKISQMQAAAQNVLVVDGVAHYRVSEPLYRLAKWGSFDQHMSIEIVHANDIKAEDDPKNIFRADRYDDVVSEYERRIGKRLTKKDSQEVVPGKIEVVLPASLSFVYDMRPRVLSVAKEMLSWMRDDVVKNDLSFATSFIGLRDAIATDEIDYDRVANMIGTEIADAMKCNDGWDEMVSKAEDLLADWHEREDQSLVLDGDIAALAM